MLPRAHCQDICLPYKFTLILHKAGAPKDDGAADVSIERPHARHVEAARAPVLELHEPLLELHIGRGDDPARDDLPERERDPPARPEMHERRAHGRVHECRALFIRHYSVKKLRGKCRPVKSASELIAITRVRQLSY